MIKSKYHPLKVWASTIGLVAGSQFVYAQEEPMTEEVIVTGFRSVLMQSQAIKRENSSISEVITAEDIGKLPDTSVAESLARLPGLAGERRNGRTSGLSVRGFNENYVGTTLNGRELLGMGDNRGVEYDLYPAEIINSVVVTKTPDASIITQGIGGTVDLRTIRPLEKDDRVLAINGSYEMNGMKSANPDYDDKGHRVAFTYSDKFMDDTVGVAVSIASMESPSQEEQFRGWGYASINADNPTLADGVTLSEGDVILGGHDSFVRSALMSRDSIAGVVQFEPNDDLAITVDALYIDFSEDKVFRGMEEGGAEWGTSSYNIDEIQDGLVTAGSWDGFRSVIRNDAESKTAELTTFGLNVEYAINDIWSAEFDLSTGESSKTITNIESYSGVGRAQHADQGDAAARSWEMTSTGVMYSAHPSISTPDYTDRDLIKLAGPQAWGGALTPIDDFAASDTQPLGPGTAQDGFVNSPDFEESLDSIRLQLNGAVEYSIISGVEIGFNYSDRSKSKTNRGAFLTAPSWPDHAGIPAAYDVGNANLNFIGIGEFIAYDSLGLYNSGYYTSTDAGRLETARMGDSYTIDEKVSTLYAMADLTSEVAGMELRGNVGFQFIDTTQKSTGFNSVIGPDLQVIATPVSDEASYTKFLPSLNLSLSITDEHVVRTALSKTISRPRMDDLRPNSQVSFSFNNAAILNSDPRNSAWSASSGNATLRPLEANQFDLAYEYYFADDGLVTAAFYYKDLTNWHAAGDDIVDFSEYYIPAYHHTQDADELPPATFEGVLSNRADGLEGFAKGIELQASVPFHLVHDSLDGFGVILTGTFSEGELGENKDMVPGLSEEVYQLTAYYEVGGFEFRISGRKRSEYLSETRGLSLALGNTVDTGSELWDAQIGYDFSESGIDGLDGLSITLQAQNLTNEDTVQFNEGDPRQITQYQSFGANYLLGVNYTF
ncbi:TonB-dependent receptor [Saccharophagus degradans]|uniref:TonB-dependent receptor n=1 Tax=Saccharophagus degradans TaxID=86304 RepID=UPI0024782A1A|nr:TonB-dependent receptor [Saccharophagus degradans]WGO97984.1 TonB-dependent receptor [Saccharophagus degradans]